MKNGIIEAIEKKHLKKNVPRFDVGDTVKVSTKIIEGTKERIQTMSGTVIARKGSGLNETFTLYRVAYGSAMERVLPIHSPRLISIECMKKGKVRRGKLYHIRGKFGKKAKIREDLTRKRVEEITEAEEVIEDKNPAVEMQPEQSAPEAPVKTESAEPTKTAPPAEKKKPAKKAQPKKTDEEKKEE